MKKENLDRGQKIQSDLFRIDMDLKELRDIEENPTGDHLMYSGYGISKKAAEEIRNIAIRSSVNKRRSLQREFNKL